MLREAAGYQDGVAADTIPGLIDGRYRLGAVIGRGGMASVVDGEDLRLGRRVAVKLLRPELAELADVCARFNTEAQLAARVVDPHAVAIYDTGVDGGVPFIVMERLSGRTLADEIGAGPIAPERAVRVVGQMLAGLEAAHRVGVIHRDVKPSNVLLTADGDAKLADFGIAKVAESANLTATGSIVGTAAYLAPERLAGQPASVASDVYSAGVVLYEALGGARPFEADTPLGVLHAIAHVDAPPLTRTSPELAGVAARAMAKDPAQRFSSAAAMAAALDGVGAVWAPTPPTTRLAAGGLDAEATTVVEGAPRFGTTAVEATAVIPQPRAPIAVDHRPADGPPPGPIHVDGRLFWAVAALAVAVLVIVVLVGLGRGSKPTASSSIRPVPTTVPVPLQRAVDELEKAIRR